MDNETKEALKELINTLLNSCTQYNNDDTDSHEHDLFDDVDKKRLGELLNDIGGDH